MNAQTTASRADPPMELVDGYQPGACNIGPAEIRRRTMAGHVGLAGTLGLLSALIAVGAPAPLRLLIIAPATISASGYIQARSRFCADYGWRGILNLGGVGDAVSVDDASARAADRRRARHIGLQAMGVGVVAGIAALFLPR